MQKLLITETGGFIGGFLVEEAIKKGYHVVAGVKNVFRFGWKQLYGRRIKFYDQKAHEGNQKK